MTWVTGYALSRRWFRRRAQQPSPLSPFPARPERVEAMTNDESTYREILEADYDRPSFHCAVWAHRVIGTISAIMEQHQDLQHKSLVDAGSTFMWYENRCDLCGFDVGAIFRGEFPELVSRDWRAADV